MKRIFVLSLTALLSFFSFAQKDNEGGIWKCNMTSSEGGIKLLLDLYEESIEVPGMDMFGPMNGYMGGNIYGVWMVTSFDIKSDTQARLRLSNDLGSETQDCLLTQVNDSIMKLELKGGVCVKKVVDKKLVKIPNSIEFKLNK